MHMWTELIQIQNQFKLIWIGMCKQGLSDLEYLHLPNQTAKVTNIQHA